MNKKPRTGLVWWLHLALAVLPVVVVIILGQVATFPNLKPWYFNLHKPVFNPPNWIFAPVWTCLYALMAYALWRVLRTPRPKAVKFKAGLLFFAQLTLNALWSWLFFALHNPLLGVMDIIPQFLLILATIKSFYRIDRPAAFCLVPLAAWVGFATLLNLAILILNM